VVGLNLYGEQVSVSVEACSSADEGELSKRLAELVRKESCADVAKSLGLLEDIKLGVVAGIPSAGSCYARPCVRALQGADA